MNLNHRFEMWRNHVKDLTVIFKNKFRSNSLKIPWQRTYDFSPKKIKSMFAYHGQSGHGYQ